MKLSKVMTIIVYFHSSGCSGISFIDSTSLAVCHNRRIASHKVFDGFAARGKTTVGWFYGFNAKGAVVESVFDQLKNISNIEHSRYRSVTNFLVNVLAGLTAYTFREKKPSLNIQIKKLALLSS